MYRQCEERKVHLYNIYGTNQSTRILKIKWFHEYRISKYLGKHFQKAHL